MWKGCTTVLQKGCNTIKRTTYMEQDQLSSLFSSGDLGERYKVDHLAEAVHDGQDNSVAVRGGKNSNKVQRYVGPWAMRNRKRLKQPSRWPAG